MRNFLQRRNNSAQSPKVERKNRSRGIGKAAVASRKFKSKLVLRKFTRTFLFILVLGLGLFLLIGGGYFSVKYVISLRDEQASANDAATSEGFVAGFDEIPVFPGSQFIFDDYGNNDTVRQFLSNGNSVYRLAPNTDSDEISAYYGEQLPKYGWELANSVPLESEEMMPGDYWIREEKGVRIYSKFNDVWYESVSTKQANNGLSDEVKKETERKLLLITSSYTDLLPDFPWRLKVPSDFLTSYDGTDITDLQSVSFKQLGHSNSVTLEPVGYIGAMPYDNFLNNYLKENKDEDNKEWRVINSVVTTVADQEAIRATITNGEKIGESVVVGNPRNSVAYTVITHEEDDPFFEYVLENIIPAKSSY